MKKFLLALVAIVALAAVTVLYITPWPSVWAIRMLFDHGAKTASDALVKHLPDNVIAQRALRYDTADRDALLDIYRPAQLDPARPTIVWIHGGGFVSGRRGDIENYLKILAGKGFAVVNVDYTIAPTATYPTPTRQFAKAIAYLDRNAGKLGINGDAFVFAGDSAGSHVAAQLANIVTAPDYARKVGITAPITPAEMKGALLHCGVFDAAMLEPDAGGFGGWFIRTVIWSYSGKREWRDVPGFETFSVGNYLTPAFPATFISAGNADPLGPQSVKFDRQLRAQGVTVTSLFYPPDHDPPLGHEYQFNLDGEAGQKALAETVKWLETLDRKTM
ncbi:alpha/beta hydrolase [Sphingorhabdus sp.]|uniref:alpha/beta hydrolase n=1 Tax=Sphingorhabdus sp. TaxID=1902408 RepID=UPI0035B28790